MTANYTSDYSHSPDSIATETFGIEINEPWASRPLTTSILRWAHLAADWEEHRPANHELSVLERGRMREDIEYEIALTLGDPFDHEPVQRTGEWYDLTTIGSDTVRAIISAPLSRSSRPRDHIGAITFEVLPWTDVMLCCGDEAPRTVVGSPVGANGFTIGAGQDLKITLASDAFPTTVFHQVAHTLAFAEDGRFQHRDRWLFYFIMLMAWRYWQMDLEDVLTSGDPSKLISAIRQLEPIPRAANRDFLMTPAGLLFTDRLLPAIRNAAAIAAALGFRLSNRAPIRHYRCPA